MDEGDDRLIDWRGGGGCKAPWGINNVEHDKAHNASLFDPTMKKLSETYLACTCDMF